MNLGLKSFKILAFNELLQEINVPIYLLPFIRIWQA